jgi:hypothetical protein
MTTTITASEAVAIAARGGLVPCPGGCGPEPIKPWTITYTRKHGWTVVLRCGWELTDPEWGAE